MKTLAAIITLALASLAVAAPDAELTAIVDKNRVTSAELIAYADKKASDLVAAQSQVAELQQQLAQAPSQERITQLEQALAAERTARVAAEAERDAARQAVAGAKTAVQNTAAVLQAEAAKL